MATDTQWITMYDPVQKRRTKVQVLDSNFLSAALGLKVAANPPITPATKTKITYDSKGLVTGGADATTADIADSTDKRYVTDAQLVIVGNTSNTNTGDETQATIKTKLGAASGAADGYLTSANWTTFNGKQAALGFTPEDPANKVTSISGSSTNAQYGSAKLLFDQLALKQDVFTFPRRTTMWADENIIISGGANASATFTSQRYNSYSVCTAPYHDGDTYSNSFWADAGTYSLVLLYLTQVNSGKMDVFIDTTKVISLLDLYSLSTTVNILSTTASITLTRGYHYIKFVMNGKNAASGGWAWVSTKYHLLQASDL